MRYSPRNIKIAFTDAGLTHYGGILFFNEFTRVLQLRRFLTRHLRYPRRNHDYQLSEMILSLAYPIILGLDRIETASLLRANGTFHYLTGLRSFPDPQTLRRFLLNAPADLRKQLHRANDRLLQRFVHSPEHRSRLLFDLDSTVVTSFGHQEGPAGSLLRRGRADRAAGCRFRSGAPAPPQPDLARPARARAVVTVGGYLAADRLSWPHCS